MDSEESTPRSTYESNNLRITLSGQLKDGERGSHGNCITRCCQIRVSDFKFNSEVGLPPAITFIFSLNKVRRTLRSPPIDLPLENRENGNLDMRITFLYTHSLKEYDDILKVQIQANMKKKQRNDVIIGYTTLDLSLVLQQNTQEEEITFKAGTGEKEEKKEKEGRGSHHDKDNKDKAKDTEKKDTESNSNPSQPFAVMRVSVWSYPEEIETMEDANDYELVPDNLTDEEEYGGESGGESMEEDEPPAVVPSSTPGNSSPNTPTKPLLAQRLLQMQAIDYPPHHNQNSGATSNSNKGGKPAAPANASGAPAAPTAPAGKKSSRLRTLWQTSKPILTRVKSKDNSDSDPGSDQEMDQYFESSSNSDASDMDERISPGIEYTPPASPGTQRAPDAPAGTNSNSNPTSPTTTAPSLPTWGSANNLLEKHKAEPPFNLHSLPASANTSFTLVSASATTSFASLPSVSSNVSTTRSENAAAIAAAIDAMRPNSPATTTSAGVAKFSNSDLSSTAGIILINGAKWRGRKLEECLIREGVHFPTRYRIVCTKRSADVQMVITNIFARQLNLMRVAIAGSDSYINEVLRPVVEQLGKKPRGWDSLHFYVLPIGKNNNDVATQVAQHDRTYKNMFFTPTWQNVFTQREACEDDVCREVQQRILKYLDEDSPVPVRFPIGEALITYLDSASKSVPFLKGVHIGDPVSAAQAQAQTQEDDHEGLQLDYWVPKKKGGSEDHLEFKGPFQFAAVTRLPCVAAALRLSPPTASVLSLIVQPRDRKGRKNVLTRHLAAKLGKKGKDEKEKGKGAEKDKDKKKKEEKDLTALVTKLSVADDAAHGVFKVVIDGVEYPGVKFVSLSPQWANHVKSFTVQAFACDTDNAPTPPISVKGDPASITASNSSSTGSLPSASGVPPASAASASSASASVSASAPGSTTPVGARGSPVLATQQQPFPPLNLNSIKQPGSPLPGSKHNTRDLLPAGMNSATDV